MHRAIVVVDVEGFGDPRRTLPHQLGTRAGLYRVLEQALQDAGVCWTDCYHEDRGDSVFVLIPPELPKAPLVEVLPGALAQALRCQNAASPHEQRTRLRIAVHAGEVAFDDHGATSTALTHGFRLLDAAALKQALADSPGTVALIVSRWIFDEVVRHSALLDAATFRPVLVVVKETHETAWIALPDYPHPSDSAVLDHLVDSAPPSEARTSPTVIPRQLPAAPALFVGRREELGRLDTAMDAADEATAVVICAIDGTGGIGKTWLALHWAHQHRDRFPDGQLFVDLRGFGPDSEPMNPAVAVRGFLDTLEIHPSRIPADLHAQAALYRSVVAGKRMLVVLDNAADATQVAPLLPGSESCKVVVTSRNRLSGLIIGHGARRLSLDVLTHAETRALLVERLGSTRVEGEYPAADELARLCGGFPLALSIVAAHALPGRSLVSLAAELGELGLDALDDHDASMPTVLSWSLSSLTSEQRTVFALLGIAPGPDIDLSAISGLTGLALPRARKALHALESASLVKTDAYGRYSMHDLIRDYAVTMAHRDIPKDARTAALRRVVDFYLHTAHSGELVLYSARRPLNMEPPVRGSCPRTLGDESVAAAWFDAEHPSLLATQHLAAHQGWHRCAWELAWSLNAFHRRRGYVHDELAVWQAAVTSARHIGAPSYLAEAHRALAHACVRAGHHTDAFRHMHQALTITDNTTPGPFDAFSFDLRQALTLAEAALSLCRTHQDPLGEADALAAVGWLSAELGDYDQARDHCENALALFRRHQDRVGEGQTLDSLGYLAHHAGHHTQAMSYYQQALTLRHEFGDLYGEAVTLNHLAELHTAAGRHEHARTIWRRVHQLVLAARTPSNR